MKYRNIHGGSNVWSAAQDRIRSTDLLLMLGLNKTIDFSIDVGIRF